MEVDLDSFDLLELDLRDFVLPGFEEFSVNIPLDLEELGWEYFQCFSDESRICEFEDKTLQQPANKAVNCQNAISGFKRRKGRKKKTKARQNAVLIERKRCSHCKSDDTPQWRLGPNGPKTLCNACGVRFKSGRLLPEYRPVASPTFDEGLHSNCHRKIMEKRR